MCRFRVGVVEEVGSKAGDSSDRDVGSGESAHGPERPRDGESVVNDVVEMIRDRFQNALNWNLVVGGERKIITAAQEADIDDVVEIINQVLDDENLLKNNQGVLLLVPLKAVRLDY